MRKILTALCAFLLLSLSLSAQMSNINTALASLCDFFVDMLPIISMLVVVAGGAVYAGGQLMGAETRARANVWATAMLMGALIGILISVLGPFVMQTMYGGTWTTACQGTGGGGTTPNCPSANPQMYCGTTCCYYGGTAACCTASQRCCGNAPNAWCCPSSSSCGPNPGDPCRST